jgi:hypothetical protein
MINELTINIKDLMWCAGLLEGEGSISSYTKTVKNSTYPIVQLQCGLHKRDKDVLERLQNLLGGTITGPYTSGLSKEEPIMLMWGIYRLGDIKLILEQLYPHFGARRQAQCDRAFESIARSKKYAAH